MEKNDRFFAKNEVLFSRIDFGDQEFKKPLKINGGAEGIRTPDLLTAS